MIRVSDLILPIQDRSNKDETCVAAFVTGNNHNNSNSVMSSVSKEFETPDHIRSFATKSQIQYHRQPNQPPQWRNSFSHWRVHCPLPGGSTDKDSHKDHKQEKAVSLAPSKITVPNDKFVWTSASKPLAGIGPKL
jgi:hypothetical protein